MEEIGIDWRYFFVQLGNFVLLLVILTKLLYRPVKNLLEKRRSEIEESVENAARVKKELESIEQKKVAETKKAREQSDVVLAKARTTAKDLEEKLNREAEEKAEKILTRAKSDIDAEKEKSLQSMKDEIAGIVEDSVEKVLHEKVSDADQKKMVEEGINKL